MRASKIKLPSRRYLELIREFPLRPIRTKTEAAAATAILDRLFGQPDADPGQEDYLDVLSDLLDSYESENDADYDAEATGIQVLRSLIEEHGMSQATLAGKLGVSAPTVSLILSSERPITAEHARNLGKIFSIDPGVFI